MNIPKEKLEFGDAYEMIEYLSDMIRHAESNRATSERLGDAHEYVKKYCMSEGWGRIVWHTILDDAIKLREGKSK